MAIEIINIQMEGRFFMDRLRDKVAIVTGGAGGIGRGIVQNFVNEGARVAIVDINVEQGEHLSRISNEEGHETLFIRTDISDPAEIRSCVDEVIGHFGQLDILVNNAHASTLKPFLEITEKDLKLSMDTGFYATFHFCQHALPHLKETKGNIINFGSGAAMKGDRTQGTYAASKEAIRGITRVIANEFGEHGINANLISPIAYSEGVKDWRAENPGYYDKVVQNIPLQRFGNIDHDIGPVAVFLASDDSQYITGQTIMADGGSIKLY